MKTPCFYLTLLLLLSGCSGLPPGTDPLAAFGFTLTRGEPVVEVLVHGQVLHLSIDTGAGSDEVALVPAVINKLNLPELKSTVQSLDMEGRRHQDRQYTLDLLTIGGIPFRDVTAGEENRDRALGDGIIGNKLLARYRIYLDYRNSRMAFLTKDQAAGLLKPGDFTTLTYNLVPAGLQVTIPIGGKAKTFILDTGTSVTDGDRAYGVVRRDPSAGSRSLYSGDPDPQDLLTVDPAVLNGKDAGPLSFVQVDLPTEFPADGLVGYNLFKDRQILIDYQDRTLSWAR